MPVINMQQKPGPLEQHENHEFDDVANQASSANCWQAKIVVCHENLASADDCDNLPSFHFLFLRNVEYDFARWANKGGATTHPGPPLNPPVDRVICSYYYSLMYVVHSLFHW